MEFSAATKSRRHWALRWSAWPALDVRLPRAGLAGGHDGVEQIGRGRGRPLQKLVVPVLDGQHAALELLLRDGVTGLAGPVDVEQRAPHPVVAHLEGADPLGGHVAVSAGHPGPRVDALVPHLELRMLRLEHLRARLGVHPVREALRSPDLVRGIFPTVKIVVGLDLLDLEAVGPRIGDDLALALEVVLHVALTADVRSHLLSGGVAIGVAVGDALPGLENLDAARNPGRVTRRPIVPGLSQSTQATGCWMRSCPLSSVMFRACAYGMPDTCSKPLTTSPRPTKRYGARFAAWHCTRRAGFARSPAASAPDRTARRRGRAGRDSRAPRCSASRYFLRSSGSLRTLVPISALPMRYGTWAISVRGKRPGVAPWRNHTTSAWPVRAKS
jgi:hypothetical protein